MAIYSKEEINASLIKVKKFLLDSIDSKKIVFFDGKRILEKSKLQALLKTRLDDELSRILLEIILENSFKAENLSAGGFQLTLKAFLQEESSCDLESYHPSKDDISMLIKEKLNQLESNLLFCALDMAGFAGKISIEKSQNDKFSIEFIDSCNFSINYLSNLLPSRLLKPKVLVIDGFVESVSEINFLLQSLSNTGHQLVLIARGFDPDVINTINVNNQRKSLFVYLVQVPFDVEGLNTLVDICSVCDCNVISSNLGQLITNVSLADAVNVDEVTLSKSKLSIKNRNSQKRVSLHLKDLYDRLKERQELSEIYEKRISSLNSNNVIIRIPDDSRFVEISQNIDTCLRSIKSAMDLGISTDKEITASKMSSIIFSKKAKKMIEDLEFVLL